MYIYTVGDCSQTKSQRSIQKVSIANNQATINISLMHTVKLVKSQEKFQR